MAEAKGDPWRTEFSVQPFTLEKRRIAARPVRPANSQELALRLGERLAPTNAGVLVYSRRVAPELGEYEDAKVLATHGTIPPEVLDHLAG